MRSFLSFLACTGFIIWAHSCDTRILGVKTHAPAPEQPAKPSFVQKNYLIQLITAGKVHPVYLDTLFITTHRQYTFRYPVKKERQNTRSGRE